MESKGVAGLSSLRDFISLLTMASCCPREQQVQGRWAQVCMAVVRGFAGSYEFHVHECIEYA